MAFEERLSVARAIDGVETVAVEYVAAMERLWAANLRAAVGQRNAGYPECDCEGEQAGPVHAQR